MKKNRKGGVPTVLSLAFFYFTLKTKTIPPLLAVN